MKLGQVRVILIYSAYKDSLPTSQKTQNVFIINTNLAVCCENLTGLTNALCWESAEFLELRLWYRTSWRLSLVVVAFPELFPTNAAFTSTLDVLTDRYYYYHGCPFDNYGILCTIVCHATLPITQSPHTPIMWQWISTR